MADLRNAVLVGGNRIPFGRIGGAYASATNIDMLTAALDGLVAQALATSPDARIAALRIEEADALLRQVDAALLPQVNVDASGSRSRISQTNATPIPSTAPITRSSARLALSTSFELDVWGKLRRASEGARAQALGTRYAADTVSLSLAAAVTQAYLNLRAIDAQLLAVDDSLSSQSRSTQLTRTRFEGGIASQLDVQQAEGALATYTAAQVQLEKSRADLAAVPDNKQLIESHKLARETLQREQTSASRLFVIDAGSDMASLRTRYPDRQRYAIVQGRFDAWAWHDDGRWQIGGSAG